MYNKIMLGKLYKKLKDVTYGDVLIINFVTIIVGMIVSLLVFSNLFGSISPVQIEWGLLFWIVVWIVSSGANSIILKILKRKK